MEVFDYVVVGAGSAGCVLADRLTACGRYRVLLLEAGGTDRVPWIKLPIGYGKTFHDPRVNWRFRTVPDPGVRDREIYWPRGRVLGGSSSINGLVWMRGLAQDFDDWRAAGNPGWSWSDVAPVFDEIEALDGDPVPGDGRISVADRSADYHPLRHAVLGAAEDLELPHASPARIHYEEGVGPYRITTRRGLRHSAADAFLRPALRRPNLVVRTQAMIARIAIEAGRATGVHYRKGGQDGFASATASVVLSAGAVGSPTILQRSGIVPGPLLQELGIPLVHANAAVGGNLQDHLGVDYLFKTSEPTMNQSLGTLTGQIGAALKFLLKRRGPLTLSVNQMGGMVRSDPDLIQPDLQLYATPLSYSAKMRNKRPLLKPDPWPGFAIGFNTCRPTSQGRVDISTAAPDEAPRIDPQYLSTNEDVTSVIAGGRLMERMLNTPPLSRMITAPNGFNPMGAGDDEILADFRARSSTVFHACGTCRMAPEDSGGVVGPDLKVHGIDGLRVVDASVFPNITSANTNAPTIMVAAKAARMILND